jgi:hypothetical protein
MSEIWDGDQRSGKTYPASLIRIQGSEKHRIPDPDPQRSMFDISNLVNKGKGG